MMQETIRFNIRWSPIEDHKNGNFQNKLSKTLLTHRDHTEPKSYNYLFSTS